jgi:hypothetical protein
MPSMNPETNGKHRRVAFLMPLEQLRCPAGHPIPRRAWSSGSHPSLVERCEHRDPPGRRADECGKLVYWLLVPGGYRIAAEVSSAEAHQMELQRLEIENVLAFLGLRWPEVAA